MTRSTKSSMTGAAGKLPDHLACLPIEDLNLSVRSRNALRRRGIDTLGQLARLSDDELLRFQAFGKANLAEVRRAMGQLLSRIETDYGPLSEPGGVVADQSVESESECGLGEWKLPERMIAELDAPVELLDLSARPLKVLNRLRVRSLRELLAYPKQKLFRAKNIGRKSLAEIENKLFAYLSREQHSVWGDRLPVSSPRGVEPAKGDKSIR